MPRLPKSYLHNGLNDPAALASKPSKQKKRKPDTPSFAPAKSAKAENMLDTPTLDMSAWDVDPLEHFNRSRQTEVQLNDHGQLVPESW